MKKLIFITAIIFNVLNPGVAQKENSLLWEISGNELEEPSYLFGTIHIICPDDLKLNDKILKSLAKAEQLVLELDMDEPGFMQKMQQLSVNPDMQNISSELSEDDLEKLNNFFTKHYQADMSKLGVLKPFALMSMMLIKAIDCPQPGSYEFALMAYASDQKWETKGLETIDEQLAVFENVSIKEQLSWLVQYAEDEERFKSQLNTMIEAYQSEEINEILNSMTDYPEYKDLEEALLYERNERWVAAFEEIAHEQPTFFAVGAAHLGSERGLIELLRKEGYRLTPVLR